jgi:hypothetical protein
MKNFEMKFHWDDQEQACYNGTETHRRDGLIKTWKLDHETDEEYQERTRKLMYEKIGFLAEVKSKLCGRFADVDNYKFG